MARLQIPTGLESFRELRENHCYYVDKTSFLAEFFQDYPNKVSLLTRPRRFGKTLTMWMLQEFLDIRNASSQPDWKQDELFGGLEIMKHPDICAKWMHQWPVALLTLKTIEGEDFEQAMGLFAQQMHVLFTDFDFLAENPRLKAGDRKDFLAIMDTEGSPAQLATSLQILCRAMQAQYGKPAVLLIDEYDVPFDYARRNDYYPKMVGFLRKFLGSALKDNPSLKFAVLTGCLRVAKESIFTGLNNFKCYGISDARFADKIGFTSAEVDKILADAGMPGKKPVFQEWYDGYRFGKCEEIYCPWDVLQYVKDLQDDPEAAPLMYWLNSSENSIVLDFLKNSGWEAKEKLEELVRHGRVESRLQEVLTYDSLYASESNLWTLLYLTGYLTKSTPGQMRSPTESICLKIPNKEVYEIYKYSVDSWYNDILLPRMRDDIADAFWKGDETVLSGLLSEFLLESVSFNDYNENFYHATLLGLMTGPGHTIKSNRENGLGRSDLTVERKAARSVLIIEVKVAASEERLDARADEALRQIEEKRYAASFKQHKNVLLWGVAFCRKSCVAKAVWERKV